MPYAPLQIPKISTAGKDAGYPPASQDRLNIPFQRFILCLFAPSWHVPDHEAQSLFKHEHLKKTRAGNMAMSQCPFQNEAVKQRLS